MIKFPRKEKEQRGNRGGRRGKRRRERIRERMEQDIEKEEGIVYEEAKMLNFLPGKKKFY